VDTKIIQLWNRCSQKVFFRGVTVRVRARAQARMTRAGATLVALLILAVNLAFPALVGAAAQGYNTSDKTIQKGMVVAVVSSSAGATSSSISVEKSSTSNADKTLGVVVDAKTDPVTVSATGDQIYVASTGTAQVYEADLNGTIKKGDLLAPSPIQGVLMKANQNATGILGVALQDAPIKATQTVKVKNDQGKEVSTKVGLVLLNMDVKFASNGQGDGQSLLQRIGQSIVRHPVSTAQVFVSLIIVSLLIVVEGGIIYGAVSSSIVSLGRNPLAKQTIFRGLGQISILVMAVLALGAGAIYLVLWV
jgi:hypothetical protein